MIEIISFHKIENSIWTTRKFCENYWLDLANEISGFFKRTLLNLNEGQSMDHHDLTNSACVQDCALFTELEPLFCLKAFLLCKTDADEFSPEMYERVSLPLLEKGHRIHSC